MKTLMILIASSLLLAACSNATTDVRSPCVGAEGAPCDRRAPELQRLALV